MNTINPIFPLLTLVPPLLIGFTSSNTWAQHSEKEIRKEHLEYCVSQMTARVSQLEAIKGVMQQESLTQRQKLEQVSQMLTPEQKQQLLACMEQPMPPQG